MPDIIPELTEKLSNTKTVGSCIIWQGYITVYGYGEVYVKKDSTKYRMLAHRLSFLVFKGAIKEYQVIHHTCSIKTCINPKHLELIPRTVHSQLEALSNGTNLKQNKTHCCNGHVYTFVNSYIYGNGYKSCNVCHANRERERRHLIKQRKEVIFSGD